MKHVLAWVAACVGIWPLSAEADGRREARVGGTLVTEVVPCSSLCTESDWEGPLDGTSSFTLISLDDLAIPNANISKFHGDLVVSTQRGDLIGQDTGIWNLDTGAYVDVYTVTSGTGAYAGATALIILSGTLDPVTGHGDSQYHGLVSTPSRR